MMLPTLDSAYSEYYDLYINEFSKTLKTFLPRSTIYIRYDLPNNFFSIEEKNVFLEKLLSSSKKNKIKIVKPKTDIQPPDTVLLDLNKSEEELLSNMKPKWRYNIKLSEKKGCTVKSFSKDTHSPEELEKALDIFYELYKTTATRDGIALHHKNYYKSLLTLKDVEQEKNGKPKITLYITYHEEDALSAIITIFTKNEAVYLYGASSNVKRNLMPSYLLQWNAIKDAKKAGCSTYDFYGIPPVNDSSHPMHGLYLFKTGFGGSIIHRVGSIDFPLSFFYQLYSLAENLRAFYYKKLKKFFKGLKSK